MGTFTNSEDPDEMLHNVAFHQGLHCLLRLKRYSDKKGNLTPLDIYNRPSQLYCIISDGRIH